MTTRVYLSGVASRTHLLYAGSYLQHLLDDGPVVLENLGLRPFLGRHRVTEADLVALLPQGVQLGGPEQPGERHVYLAIGAPGIKPLLRLRLRSPLRRLHVVVVDEGLGSYGDWRTRRDAWRREGHAAWWASTRALAVAGARHLLTSERWALYRRTPQGWELDERVAAALRPPTGATTGRPPYAVLLSQPLVQLGLLTEQAQQQLLRDLRAGCALAGLELVVRPHPAEDGPTPSDVPAERDPVVAAAAVVLGTASTALLNVAALGLTRAVRLDVPGVRASEAALSEAQRSLLAAFLPAAVRVEDLGAALA